jgi:hypothetical protein
MRLHFVKIGERTLARSTVPADDGPPIDIPTLVEEERNRWPLNKFLDGLKNKK